MEEVVRAVLGSNILARAAKPSGHPAWVPRARHPLAGWLTSGLVPRSVFLLGRWSGRLFLRRLEGTLQTVIVTPKGLEPVRLGGLGPFVFTSHFSFLSFGR